MDPARYAALFVSEGREHLGTCNQLLRELADHPDSTEPVSGLFRAMHTLKGMAAMMGYAAITDLAHRTENLLELVRGKKVTADRALVELLSEAVDALDAGVDEVAAGREAGLSFGEVTGRIDLVAGAAEPAAEAPSAMVTAGPSVAPPRKRGGPRPQAVLVRIAADAPMPGVRALLVLQQARTLGDVEGVQPAEASFQQAGFRGEFRFWLASRRAASTIIKTLSATGEVASVTVGEEAVPEEVASGESAASGSRVQHLIRVDRRRLDALMNHVGELVVARNRLLELAADEPDSELAALGGRINRLVADIQNEVIAARLTPVWQVFDRFPRAVRDLARDLGKQVALSMEGTDIEVDRSMLDEIGDPLLHLLRNAVDHGIETPAARRAAGKAEEGRITLRGRRERNRVVFDVLDDGAGIDRAAILKKAQAAGVVGDDVDTLDDDALLRVLGRAGFSTAERVTSVSGRGVGIDVVLTRIRSLGGSVELHTVAGSGTHFTLRLPLTLVIFRALVARVGGERYVVPMAFVSETVHFSEASHADLDGRPSLVLRGDVLPTIDLREVVAYPENHVPARRPCIVLEVGDRRTALVVDALLGQREIVVEQFEAPHGMPLVFSGATILADGAPALILDAASLC